MLFLAAATPGEVLNMVFKSLLSGFWQQYGLIGTILVIAVIAFIIWSRTKRGKGKLGESAVNSGLSLFLGSEYILLKDVTLQISRGTTTQIDTIVLSKFGIFVIETKNYIGKIYCNENATSWTVYYRNGQEKKFQNPLRQNYAHQCALADAFGIDMANIHSIVAMVGECKLCGDIPDNVCLGGRSAAKIIKRFQQQVFSEQQVKDMADFLNQERLARGRETDRQHVQNLKERHAVPQIPVCPKCGATLVLRTAKHGANAGNKFYGCSNYPQCRHIENVNTSQTAKSCKEE